MISSKMKEDAAKINSEIKIIATKIPLAFHNYNYLNEDVTVVLKRRNDQLDEIKGLKEFLNENAKFTSVLISCEKELENVNDELEQLGMTNKFSDTSANNSDDDDKNCSDDSNGLKGNAHNNKTISRNDSFIPDTPAIKNRKKLDFVRK